MTVFAADAVFEVADAAAEISAVPDGYLIYQPTRERVHYLNPTAVVVYELCAAGRSVTTIEAFLKDAYGLAETPSDSVRACIASLQKEGLIRPCPSSPAL